MLEQLQICGNRPVVVANSIIKGNRVFMLALNLCQIRSGVIKVDPFVCDIRLGHYYMIWRAAITQLTFIENV